MEAEVKETYYSLIGVQPLLDDLYNEVVTPIMYNLYGFRMDIHQIIKGWNGNPPTPLKFILLTGPRGSGKTAVTSAVVNMLRKKKGEIEQFIRYKNDKIKYIRWNRYGGQEGLAEEFRKILKDAKAKEDGRDFTVLHFPYMETAFHSLHRSVRSEELLNLRKAFLEDLGPSNGASCVRKLLIIGETTFPERMLREVRELAERTFHIPAPEAEVKLQISKNIVQMAGVEVSAEVLNTVASSNLLSSPGDLKQVFEKAIERARERNRYAPGTVHLELGDFPLPRRNRRRLLRRRRFDDNGIEIGQGQGQDEYEEERLLPQVVPMEGNPFRVILLGGEGNRIPLEIGPMRLRRRNLLRGGAEEMVEDNDEDREQNRVALQQFIASANRFIQSHPDLFDPRGAEDAEAEAGQRRGIGMRGEIHFFRGDEGNLLDIDQQVEQLFMNILNVFGVGIFAEHLEERQPPLQGENEEGHQREVGDLEDDEEEEFEEFEEDFEDDGGGEPGERIGIWAGQHQFVGNPQGHYVHQGEDEEDEDDDDFGDDDDEEDEAGGGVGIVGIGVVLHPREFQENQNQEGPQDEGLENDEEENQAPEEEEEDLREEFERDEENEEDEEDGDSVGEHEFQENQEDYQDEDEDDDSDEDYDPNEEGEDEEDSDDEDDDDGGPQ